MILALLLLAKFSLSIKGDGSNTENDSGASPYNKNSGLVSLIVIGCTGFVVLLVIIVYIICAFTAPCKGRAYLNAEPLISQKLMTHVQKEAPKENVPIIVHDSDSGEGVSVHSNDIINSPKPAQNSQPISERSIAPSPTTPKKQAEKKEYHATAEHMYLAPLAQREKRTDWFIEVEGELLQ